MNISVFVKRHPVLTYFVLTFVISWGAVLVVMGLSGGIPNTKEQFDQLLPVAIVVMLFGPSTAGILLTGLINGKAGLRELFSGLFKWRAGIRWYLIAILSAPILMTATLFVLSLFSPQFLPGIINSGNRLSGLLFFIMAALVTGILEELGWTGFATPQLRRRHSIFATGLIVGVLWGAWHIIGNVVMASGTYSGTIPLTYFLILNSIGDCIGQLPAFRVLMVWVYDRTGSLLVAIIMHVSITASTMILEPQGLSGMSLFVYGYTNAALMWGLVAAVAVATRGNISRQPPGR